MIRQKQIICLSEWPPAKQAIPNLLLILIGIGSCIAISGLASHPFGSWAYKESNFMWLRDKLPRDVPGLRCITYGYDTTLVQSQSVKTIDDIARSFLSRLHSIWRASPTRKPILFLAHSLGGVVLKRALVEIANAQDGWSFVLDDVKAALFFGTPNKGMPISHLLPMVENQPNESLVEALAPNSEYLRDLEEKFDGIARLRNIRLISIFETQWTEVPNVGCHILLKYVQHIFS